MAVVCIQLFDSQPNDPGSLHVQSQRFLNPDWSGLDGNGMCGTSPDPPLRHLMELLASGEATLCDFFTQLQVPTGCHDQELIALALSKHSLLYWVSSFRLEPRPMLMSWHVGIIFCVVKPINTITHYYHYQLNSKHWQWQLATATVVISNETLIRIFYHMSLSLSVTKVRIAERSVEGRHSVIHHILKRAPRASVPYLSLELRFPSLQRVAATSPGCLQSIMNHLMGMERTDGLRKAVMWLVVICHQSKPY